MNNAWDSQGKTLPLGNAQNALPKRRLSNTKLCASKYKMRSIENNPLKKMNGSKTHMGYGHYILFSRFSKLIHNEKSRVL